MSTQQQIDAWNAAVVQKQQEKADQETILKVEQEQLAKAEQARINAELAAARAASRGASPEQVAELQRQARLADSAESDARIAAGKTQRNIESLDGSIRYNTSQRDQFQAALPAQGTAASTVADRPANARTNTAEIAPAPVPAPAAAAPVLPSQRGDNGGFVTNAQGELLPADSAEAEEIRAEQNRVEELNAAPQREFVYDETTGEMVASDSDQALELREEASREENRVRFENAPPGQEFVYDEATGEMVPGDSDQADEIRAEQAPEAVPPTLSAIWDPETESYAIWADPPGEIQQSGFATEAEATAAAGDPFEAARLEREAELNQEQPAVFEPDPVPPTLSVIWDSDSGSFGIWEEPPGAFKQTGFATEDEARRAIDSLAPDVDLPTPPDDGLTDEERAEQAQADAEAAAKENAINQATRSSVYKKEGSSDWRVRLQLAPTSDYLYNVPVNPNDGTGPGILAPLADTNGVIFPYTPQINTSYRANYEQYDLVHSNYRGVYYKNSRVDDLSIRAVFTAQDTQEANYLLAVIHFFRSVTKMFYGKDPQHRGSPPPLVYLSGLGMNQFYGHPCVVSSFQYNLPDNVDYIRATSVNNYGTDLLSRRTATRSSGIAGIGGTATRLAQSDQLKAWGNQQASARTPDPVVGSVNSTQLANYVPTKMEIDITLIPVQTRSQVSKQFSLKGFANGDLIKNGFW
jgi:hypothetical protein